MALVREMCGFRLRTWVLAFAATGVWHWVFFTQLPDGLFEALFHASWTSALAGIPAFLCAIKDTNKGE